MSDPAALFDIPASFRYRRLQGQPHHEEIIVTLMTRSDRVLCSFLFSELTEDSPFRRALSEIVQKIEEIAEHCASATGAPPRR